MTEVMSLTKMQATALHEFATYSFSKDIELCIRNQAERKVYDAEYLAFHNHWPNNATRQAIVPKVVIMRARLVRGY